MIPPLQHRPHDHDQHPHHRHARQHGAPEPHRISDEVERDRSSTSSTTQYPHMMRTETAGSERHRHHHLASTAAPPQAAAAPVTPTLTSSPPPPPPPSGEDDTAPNDPTLLLRVCPEQSLPQFPSPLPIQRATLVQTLVYSPQHDKTAVVRNILVPSVTSEETEREGDMSAEFAPPQPRGQGQRQRRPSGTAQSSGFAFSDGQNEDMDTSAAMDVDDSSSSAPVERQQQQPARAYWLQRTLRSAIYGRVRFAVVLRPHYPAENSNSRHQSDARWEITEERVAVKEMKWSRIRQLQGRHAENPMNEVGALKYLMERRDRAKRRREEERRLRRVGLSDQDLRRADAASRPRSRSSSRAGGRSRGEDHVLVPLDIVSDDSNLYVVSPYCDGGELFDLLDETDKFSEQEARYWMKQVLLGLEHLQSAGICHRDLSLENLLVHDRRSLVIDLGMCLRIPFEDDAQGDDDVEENEGDLDEDEDNEGRLRLAVMQRRRLRRRLLMPPQGTCGKWHYMSPEILSNADPFDGFAVDLWAAGVILFLMVTGFPPWERACDSDERFVYLTGGYMVQLLTQWDMGLSDGVMDLLQKMLHRDPSRRLTLREAMEHPWLSRVGGSGGGSSPRSPPAA